MEKQHIIGAIIPAAGKGSRMQSKTVNKVVINLGGRPMISYIVKLLQQLHIAPIIVVVGFAKESVMEALRDQKVVFAYQEKQLGVADAVMCGVKELPSLVSDVIVMNGDDSALYDKKTIQLLIQKHSSTGAAITFFTMQSKNPHGLGRIRRDKKGNVIAIIEEKDATEEEKAIQETNIGCYIFQAEFLKRYLPKVKISPVTVEYYVTDLISLAAENNLKIVAVQNDTMIWRGINTKEELDRARQLLLNQK